MRPHKFFIVVIIWMLFANLFCSAQNQIDTAVFNLRALGMNVGKITVHQESRGEALFVEAISEIEVWIIFKIKAKYIQTSVHKNGELKESSLKTYKDGEVNSDTRLTKSGDGYILKKDQILSQIDDKIEYSGSLLYLNEPKDVTDMYLEINGEKTTIEPLGDHEYSVMDPRNGRKNRYTYKNGILQNAIIRHSVANVYLERVVEMTDITSSK